MVKLFVFCGANKKFSWLFVSESLTQSLAKRTSVHFHDLGVVYHNFVINLQSTSGKSNRKIIQAKSFYKTLHLNIDMHRAPRTVHHVSGDVLNFDEAFLSVLFSKKSLKKLLLKCKCTIT